MNSHNRPLSPHIQIYRWTLTMALSIIHRASGLALYAGTGLLAGWLAALAAGEDVYLLVQAYILSDLGLVILFFHSWALFQHLAGGLRHFVWDLGAGFELNKVEWLARASAAAPLLANIIFWYFLFQGLGQ